MIKSGKACDLIKISSIACQGFMLMVKQALRHLILIKMSKKHF